MHNDQERLRTAYESAVQALSPLPRAAFMLCRVDDLSYREVGQRLSIAPAVVQDCIALTLFSFSVLWRGRAPDRSMPTTIIEAEAALFQEFRIYCARAFMALVPVAPETSNNSACAKHDRGIIQSPHRWTLGIQNYLTHSSRQKRRPTAIPAAKTFDEWLRNRSGAQDCYHDQRHAEMLC